jgi:ubiquinol-cytochrome c reductase cytochrome c1 subunit
MIRKLTLTAVAILGLSVGSAQAAGGAGYVTDYDFSFEGPFGVYDRNQLQRGLQVYMQVCAACHGLQYVPIRTLGQRGGPQLPDDQVRALASEIEVWDETLRDFRPATPNDHFPSSNMETAPDLSLMAKARMGFPGPYGLGLNMLMRGIGGPEYIASLLTHYTGDEDFQAGTLFYGNETFPGGWIAMAPPLFDGQVDYADGTEATVEQMAQDVAAFLMWTAEPHMTDRKKAAFVGLIFLLLLASLLYLTNKRLWAPIKKAAKST